MVRKILTFGDETLRKTSKPMQKFDLRLWLLLRDMADTMNKAEGVGGLIELINPEIIAQEGEQEGSEGCLSAPGRRGYVKRPNKVTVRAQDRKGKFFEITGEGLLARAFCHELDHLDGILYSDKEEYEIKDDEDEEEQK